MVTMVSKVVPKEPVTFSVESWFLNLLFLFKTNIPSDMDLKISVW